MEKEIKQDIKMKINDLIVVLPVLMLILTLEDIYALKVWEANNEPAQPLLAYHLAFGAEFFILSFLLAYYTKSLIPFSLLIFYGFNIEDTAYYLIQDGKLPDVYNGVPTIFGSWNPTKAEIIKLNIIGLSLMSLLIGIDLTWHPLKR